MASRRVGHGSLRRLHHVPTLRRLQIFHGLAASPAEGFVQHWKRRGGEDDQGRDAGIGKVAAVKDHPYHVLHGFLRQLTGPNTRFHVFWFPRRQSVLDSGSCRGVGGICHLAKLCLDTEQSQHQQIRQCPLPHQC